MITRLWPGFGAPALHCAELGLPCILTESWYWCKQELVSKEETCYNNSMITRLWPGFGAPALHCAELGLPCILACFEVVTKKYRFS